MKEYSLKQLREMCALTEEQLARKMSISQSAISRIESRKDLKISTIHRYINALGGRLEINVITEYGKITLNG